MPTYEHASTPSRYDVCPRCSGPKMIKAAICATCRATSAEYRNRCEKCGKRVGEGQQYCLPCKRQVFDLVPHCVDCGGPIKRQYAKSQYAKRCWPCEVERRRKAGAATRAAKPACSADGCAKPSHAKGLCRYHYARQLQKRMGDLHGRQNKGAFMRLLALWPCQLCGYDRMKSHVHRVIEGRHGGDYLPLNIVALCARCHEEIHRGLSTVPTPPTAEEILASAPHHH